jgi:TRAP-type C4-dicarboxylate transport system permease small subunit
MFSMQRTIKFVSRSLEGVVLALMALQVIVVVLGVTFRYLGNSLVWYDELASILLAWLTYFGAALAALHRGHIGFAGLMKALPPALRLSLYALGEILVIGFFAVTFWYGYVVLGVMDDEYLITMPFIPTILVQAIIPLGAALFIVAELLSMREGWNKISHSPSAVEAEIPALVADTE